MSLPQVDFPHIHLLCYKNLVIFRLPTPELGHYWRCPSSGVGRRSLPPHTYRTNMFHKNPVI